MSCRCFGMFTIFHIIDNIGIGGAQTMMFELYLSIRKYYPGYNQKIIYTKTVGHDPIFSKSYEVDCKHIKDSNKIISLIKGTSPSVVIYHKLASSTPVLIDKIRREARVKTIVINHTLYETSSWKKFKNLDVMVAVSNHMKKKLSGWYPKINVVCILNGVSKERYEGISPAGTDKKDIFLTGRINRICTWKHSNKWVEWCQNVKLPVKMVHEYIGSGVGGAKSRSAKIKSKKGRNIVNMLGGISDFKQKIAIVKSWDVFLYETNRDEGISMAILEALACGVPVICSNHYGNKEIIEDGINGYVFKNKDDAKQILKRLINNRDELDRLRKSTVKHFEEKLDAKHTAGKYIKLVNDISNNKLFKGVEVPPKIEKDKNKFTIITSGYNKGKYLDEWASSIIRQKYRPLEVVFANDKSEDDTLTKIEGIKEKFKNSNIEFKLVDNPKQLYCGGSYHNLVDHVSGFYVGVLDADDMLAEGAVEYVMSLYEQNPDIYWIYTQFLWCDGRMRNGRKGINSVPLKGQSLLDLGDRGIHGVGSGWRTFSHKIERPDKLFGRHLTCAVDKNMGYRLEESGPGLFTERKCYIHRGHPIGSTDSVSSTKHAIEMWKQVIKEAHGRRKRYKKKIYGISSVGGKDG